MRLEHRTGRAGAMQQEGQTDCGPTLAGLAEYDPDRDLVAQGFLMSAGG
jgi:hypothetical protein